MTKVFCNKCVHEMYRRCYHPGNKIVKNSPFENEDFGLKQTCVELNQENNCKNYEAYTENYAEDYECNWVGIICVIVMFSLIGSCTLGI